MVEQRSPSGSQSAFSRALGNFFRILIRLLFVLVIGALLGAGVYYGIPWLYRQFVEPVRQNTIDISILDQRTTIENENLREETQTLKKRIATLESTLDEVAASTGSYDMQITESAEQLARVEGEVTKVRRDFEGELELVRQDVDALSEVLAEWQPVVEDAVAEVSVQSEVAAAQAQELNGSLALLQASQNLLRVRLLLLEENPRGARDTVELTTLYLDQAALALPDRVEALTEIRERVVALDELIVQNSLRLNTELEAVWADVMDLVLVSGVQPSEVITITGVLTSPIPAPLVPQAQ